MEPQAPGEIGNPGLAIPVPQRNQERSGAANRPNHFAVQAITGRIQYRTGRARNGRIEDLTR